MIISVSGRINSGKDTVGKIAQLLIEFPHFNNDAIIKWLDRDLPKPKFEIKKFADSLKDMVCILLGCTREQLEDRELKEKELGEEWWYYKATGFPNADKIYNYSDNKEKGSSQYYTLIKPTPRLLLQLLGTECGREILHPNIWVNALMSKYIKREDKESKKLAKIYEYPNWIITDTRFPNELKAVKDKGGISIRVSRPKNDLDNHKDCVKTEDGYCIQSENNYCKGSCKYEHPSEASLDSATFDFVINNDKDLKHLINEVKKILEKLSII